MLRTRWLGTVPYREALAVQQALFDHGHEDHLLLLEHPHVFTYGPRSDLASNLRCEPAAVGADFVGIRRGGDITYHGPGQLVGYPILTIPNALGAAAHVRNVEQLVIDALATFGVSAGRMTEYPGVWVDADGPEPRKICAIGVRLKKGRTMHGFALNVATDLTYMREHIVACGIPDRPVTSLAEEGVHVPMRDVVDVVARLAEERWGSVSRASLRASERSADGGGERQDVAWRHRPDDLSLFSRGQGPGEPVRLASRLAAAGVTDGLSIESRKPEWLRLKVHHGPEVLALKRTTRDLGLVTVCEEAGCPNLSECWADGTATFMVLGERCTRACGFCLVDTRKPEAPAADEAARVAEAVERMGLDHAVLTMVARDDLTDGGMAHVAACVEAIRARRPGTRIETLISDARGDDASLQLLFAVRPDVLNHNVETVARLQRAVRPSAGYARSLAVLARAKAAGLTTKSGLIVGMGETDDEVVGTLADLAGIGVDIVTIGQYLRPTSHHLPVERWVDPATFADWAIEGERLGIRHVEASPLTRSSYHAKSAADHVTPVVIGSR
jgi:lipoyl synthase